MAAGDSTTLECVIQSDSPSSAQSKREESPRPRPAKEVHSSPCQASADRCSTASTTSASGETGKPSDPRWAKPKSTPVRGKQARVRCIFFIGASCTALVWETIRQAPTTPQVQSRATSVARSSIPSSSGVLIQLIQEPGDFLVCQVLRHRRQAPARCHSNKRLDLKRASKSPGRPTQHTRHESPGKRGKGWADLSAFHLAKEPL